MKVLVTGAGGQLGHELASAFAHAELSAMTSSDLDVTKADDVAAAIGGLNPDVVVNAAAYTNVDGCETETDLAWSVNAGGPWNLARACEATNALLVQVSTDYVFDGTSPRPYTEFDTTGPLSVYGRTKDAGEQLVRETLDRHLIVRTSWVQGFHGRNFVKTMLRLGRERNELSVVDDQHGSPTFADDLAAAIADLVEADQYGTFHRTNSNECTWFEFARAIFAAADLAVEVQPITTEQFGAPAPRPANSILDNTKAGLLGLPPLPAWQDGLAKLVPRLL